MNYTYGSVYPFTATFRHADGAMAASVTDPSVHLIAPDASTLDVAMTELETGKFALDWTVPDQWPLGVTRYCYRGTFDGGTWSSDEESFIVVAPGGVVTPGAQDVPYCSVADVRFRANTITADILSDEVVRDLIEQAQGEVDAYLAKRYRVPFTRVPAVVRSITADLAASLALLNQHSGDGTAEEVPLHGRLRAMARGKLTDLANGVTVLHTAPQEVGVRLSGRTGLRPTLATFDGESVPVQG